MVGFFRTGGPRLYKARYIFAVRILQSLIIFNRTGRPADTKLYAVALQDGGIAIGKPMIDTAVRPVAMTIERWMTGSSTLVRAQPSAASSSIAPMMRSRLRRSVMGTFRLR
jgi:hypothetical protein